MIDLQPFSLLIFFLCHILQHRFWINFFTKQRKQRLLYLVMLTPSNLRPALLLSPFLSRFGLYLSSGTQWAIHGLINQRINLNFLCCLIHHKSVYSCLIMTNLALTGPHHSWPSLNFLRQESPINMHFLNKLQFPLSPFINDIIFFHSIPLVVYHPMGCCMSSNCSYSDKQEKEIIISSIDQNVTQKNFNKIKTITNEEGGRNSSTLEDCLLASPNPAYMISNGSGDFQVFKQLFQKLHPSSPEDHSADFFTPRISFSAEKLGLLGKLNEEEEEELCGAISRTQSGKLKKRVSFRLPEEADIFIFSSSPEHTQYTYKMS